MKRLLLAILAACALLSTALAGHSFATPSSASTAQTAQHRTAPEDTTAPGPVSGLTVSGNTLHSISLEWAVPKDADLARVLIRRALGDQPPLSASDGTLVAVLGPQATRFTDRNLDSGTTYSYAVYASDRQQNLSAASTLTALTLTTNDRTGIRGVLTDKQGNPIAGASVEVRVVYTGEFAGEATTGADGGYRVTNINPGAYAVCFKTTPQTRGRSASGYLNGCYRQQPFGYEGGGTPVTVTAGKTVNGINDYLSVAGAISGRITDPSARGVGNVRVYAAFPWYARYSATSSADGSYTITGLPADTYQVCFDASHATGAVDTGYLDECYDNLPAWDEGTDVPVRLGHTTSGIDAILAVGGAVTGKVTDTTGNPAPGVHAFLMPTNGDGYTDAQGVYRMAGVLPGAYTVCVDGDGATSPTAPYGYIRYCQYSHTEFELPAGQTVTQNRTLEIAGALGGSVSGPDGNPVAGVWTTVYDSAGAVVNFSLTDESGNWQLPGFTPGRYTVCYDPTYTSGGFRRACYADKPYGATTGTPVTVTAGRLTTVNEALHLGSTILGTVTDNNGTPLEGVGITVYPRVGDSGGDTNPYYEITDEAGHYALIGLSAGNYAVCFDGSYAHGPVSGGYTSECYDNQASLDTADPVAVLDAGSVTVDADLTSGSLITGLVTDPHGDGLPGVRVVATSTASGQSRSTSTNLDGTYGVHGLRAGDYTVCFDPGPSWGGSDTGYLQECWQDQQGPFGGTPVHVDGSSALNGIDAQLAIGGAVTGTVTDSRGAALMDILVDVQGTDGVYYDTSYTYTDYSGQYTLIGLPAVPLVICFQQPYIDTEYLRQCYRNAPGESSATPITPTSGSFTDGIDAVLQDKP